MYEYDTANISFMSHGWVFFKISRQATIIFGIIYRSRPTSLIENGFCETVYFLMIG